MLSLLLTIALVAGLVAYKWLQRAPEEVRKRATRAALIYGAVAVAILLAVTGKLNPLIAAAAALVPLAYRALGAWELIRKATGAGVAGLHSEIRGRHVRLVVDPRTGRVGGHVVDGPLRGRALDDLQPAELVALLDLCRASDPDSGALLEAYLDQSAPAWRSQWGRTGNGRVSGSANVAGMTIDEAREILGVQADASAEAIAAAHKRLIQRLHPDRGGSSYLAARVNLARSTLLDHR